MATTITVQDRLSQVLVSWCGLLSSWAADGSLVSAAESALALNSSNALPGSASLLQSLSTQWAAGEFSSLPPILLLPAEAISGAYGAYATSTDSIYINESWLLTASDEQIAAVLTEELGHFLDAHLNQSDTPGDEGEVFSNLLLSPSAAASSSSADDSIVITVNGTSISAEAATATNTLNIDLSQGPQAIIAKASITDATGLGYYSLRFKNLNDTSNGQNDISLSFSQPISGTRQAGNYLSLLNLPDKTSTGTWVLSSVFGYDNANNQINLYRNQTYTGTTTTTADWTTDQLNQLKAIGINDPNSLTFTTTGTAPATADKVVPVFTGLSLSTKTIDLSKGPQAIIAKASITDATGLGYYSLRFKNLNDTSNGQNDISLSFSQPISGTRQAGNYLSLLNLPDKTSTGTWVLSSVFGYDNANNQINLYRNQTYTGTTTTTADWTTDQLNQLKAIGINDPNSLTFTTTGTAPASADKAAPVFQSIALSAPTQALTGTIKSLDTSAGTKDIVIELDLKDLESGLGNSYDNTSSGVFDKYYNSSFIIGYLRLVGPTQASLSTLYSSDLVNGTLNNGTFRTSIKVDSGIEPGQWRIGYFSINDKAGNITSSSSLEIYTNSGNIVDSEAIRDIKTNALADALGIGASSLKFQIINSSYVNTTDTAAPQITGIRLSSQSIDVSSNPQTISIDLDLQDSGLGLGTNYIDDGNLGSDPYIGNITFVGPANQSRTIYIRAGDLVSGTLSKGAFRKTLTLDSTSEAGTWRLGSYYFSDKAGNQTSSSSLGIYNNLSNTVDSEAIRDIKTNALADALGIGASSLKFQIINSSYVNTTDTAAPQITGISLSSQSIDVSSNPQTISIDIDLQDSGLGLGTNYIYDGNLGSDLYIGNITFVGPANQSRTIYIRAGDLVSGTLSKGAFRKTLTLDSTSEAGTWRLGSYYFSDKAGNQTSSSSLGIYNNLSNTVDSEAIRDIKTNALADALGIGASSLKLQVLNSTYQVKVDQTPPQLLGIRISDTSNLPALSIIEDKGNTQLWSNGKELFISTPISSTSPTGKILLDHVKVGAYAQSNTTGLTPIAAEYDQTKGYIVVLFKNATTGASPTTIYHALTFNQASGRLTGYYKNNGSWAGIGSLEGFGSGYASNDSFVWSSSAQFQHIFSGVINPSVSSSTTEASSTISSNAVTKNINSTNNISTTINIAPSLIDSAIAKALAGNLIAQDPTTNTQLNTAPSASVVKTLSDLTASKPLSDTAKQLLDRYVVKDPGSTATTKASATNTPFLDFTLNTGSLKSLNAEIQLASEVSANAYVKVNPNTGEAYDFTYDPVTGLGAELLDTNKNGLVDSLRIHLQDGAKGDADGIINGQIRDPGVLANAPRENVYRFFKASKGVHLYTSSDAERANVNSHPEWGYKDEGIAYSALATQGKALHRFFNAKASYHFMTTSDEEAKNVNAHPEWGFTDEGDSFRVSTIPQLGMSTPVNRFFRVLDGVGQHFYTANSDEANNILAHPEWGYKSEGVGWYV